MVKEIFQINGGYVYLVITLENVNQINPILLNRREIFLNSKYYNTIYFSFLEILNIKK